MRILEGQRIGEGHDHLAGGLSHFVCYQQRQAAADSSLVVCLGNNEIRDVSPLMAPLTPYFMLTLDTVWLNGG